MTPLVSSKLQSIHGNQLVKAAMSASTYAIFVRNRWEGLCVDVIAFFCLNEEAGLVCCTEDRSLIDAKVKLVVDERRRKKHLDDFIKKAESLGAMCIGSQFAPFIITNFDDWFAFKNATGVQHEFLVVGGKHSTSRAAEILDEFLALVPEYET